MCIDYNGNTFDTALKKQRSRKLGSHVHPLSMDRVSQIITSQMQLTTKRRSIIRPARGKIRASLRLRCIPVSYSFGMFDGYDATYASSWFMFGIDIDVGCLLSFRTERQPLRSLSHLKSPCWTHLYRLCLMCVAQRGATLSANASQLCIADKDMMSACVAPAKERHEAHGREIYSLF